MAEEKEKCEVEEEDEAGESEELHFLVVFDEIRNEKTTQFINRRQTTSSLNQSRERLSKTKKQKTKNKEQKNKKIYIYLSKSLLFVNLNLFLLKLLALIVNVNIFFTVNAILLYLTNKSYINNSESPRSPVSLSLTFTTHFASSKK